MFGLELLVGPYAVAHYRLHHTLRDPGATTLQPALPRLGVYLADSLAEPGDTYLFCSDGLHGTLPDSEIARIVRDPAGDLADQAQALTEAALAAGGSDNVSVVLARPLAV